MRVWVVLRERFVESRFEALRGEALTPFVGREEEMKADAPLAPGDGR